MGILSSIGQGDKYFEELYKKYGLKPSLISFRTDGKINYNGDVSFYNCDFEKLPFSFNKVGGEFRIESCENLKTLEGCPKTVEENFVCMNCKNLTTIKDGPKVVEGNYSCMNCKSLKTLEGCPKKVKGMFSCRGCTELKNLEGGPREVRGDYYCSDCIGLETLEGAPKVIRGTFYCHYSLGRPSSQFTMEYVKKYIKGNRIFL